MKPPTVEEIAEYCAERDNGIDAEHFWAHYESQGWRKNNGQPVVKWRACVITWEKRNKGKAERTRRGARGIEAWGRVKAVASKYPTAGWQSIEPFQQAREALPDNLRRLGEALGWKSIQRALDDGKEDTIRAHFLREFQA